MYGRVASQASPLSLLTAISFQVTLSFCLCGRAVHFLFAYCPGNVCVCDIFEKEGGSRIFLSLWSQTFEYPGTFSECSTLAFTWRRLVCALAWSAVCVFWANVDHCVRYLPMKESC